MTFHIGDTKKVRKRQEKTPKLYYEKDSDNKKKMQIATRFVNSAHQLRKLCNQSEVLSRKKKKKNRGCKADKHIQNVPNVHNVCFKQLF